MSVRCSFVLAVSAVCLSVVLAGCGGRTAPDSGRPGARGASHAEADGCVDIETLPSDLPCATDGDCTQVPSGGTMCPGYPPDYLCETPVNLAGAARIQAELAAIAQGFSSAVNMESCDTAERGVYCLAGQCTACPDGPDPMFCSSDAGHRDAGNPLPDAASDVGGRADAPSSGGCSMFGGGVCPANTTCDVYFCPTTAPTYATSCSCGSDGQWVGLCAASCPAETCVDIDLSTYDTACTKASDCITILAGEVCSGSCDCFGPAVSASEQSRYDQAVSGIVFAECPCVSPGPLECVAGTCVLCGYEGASCPDAG
jgi:hypothetical protein